MSAEIAIKLTGSQYRELVNAIEIVAVQRQSRRNDVSQRLIAFVDEPLLPANLPVKWKESTKEQVAEYESLQLEKDELDSFFRAKAAFFS